MPPRLTVLISRDEERKRLVLLEEEIVERQHMFREHQSRLKTIRPLLLCRSAQPPTTAQQTHRRFRRERLAVNQLVVGVASKKSEVFIPKKALQEACDIEPRVCPSSAPHLNHGTDDTLPQLADDGLNAPSTLLLPAEYLEVCDAIEDAIIRFREQRQAESNAKIKSGLNPVTKSLTIYRNELFQPVARGKQEDVKRNDCAELRLPSANHMKTVAQLFSHTSPEGGKSAQAEALNVPGAVPRQQKSSKILRDTSSASAQAVQSEDEYFRFLTRMEHKLREQFPEEELSKLVELRHAKNSEQENGKDEFLQESSMLPSVHPSRHLHNIPPKKMKPIGHFHSFVARGRQNKLSQVAHERRSAEVQKNLSDILLQNIAQ